MSEITGDRYWLFYCKTGDGKRFEVRTQTAEWLQGDGLEQFMGLAKQEAQRQFIEAGCPTSAAEEAARKDPIETTADGEPLGFIHGR